MPCDTKLCIIARADTTGLGIQSRNWVRLLNPHKVIVIDSRPFNGNAQHFEWYEGRKNAFIVNGFIKPNEINSILNDVDTLLTFEIPYNYDLFNVAKSRGVKTILQNNWEFTDYLNQPHLPLPDLLINHSYWHLDEQKQKWPEITDYCPTPVFLEDFIGVREYNMTRTGKVRFLHVAGRQTYKDRNGTQDLIAAIKLIPQEIDFELVIRTQTTEIPEINDPRVVIDHSIIDDERDLYRDFDVMIMPRRYAGACLPMNEALASGLPVIMTDIDPNNKILPAYWLVKAKKVDSFMARTNIDVFASDITDLAARIAQFAVLDRTTLDGYKQSAFGIAQKEYSSEAVFTKWKLFLNKLGVK